MIRTYMSVTAYFGKTLERDKLSEENQSVRFETSLRSGKRYFWENNGIGIIR